MKTFNRILRLIIITVIIGITIPAYAERIKYSGVARTSTGTVLGTATVSTYLAGTTTPAGVYTASSGGAAVYSVTSDTGGRFTFYVDTADYGFVQQFKVVATKDGYETVSLDNIYELQLPTDAAGYLKSDGAGAYSWADETFDEDGDYVLTGSWNFSGATVTLPPIAVLYLESSDVTQPVTSILDTNQFAGFFKIDSSLGGLDIYGITDGDAPYGALRLTGITGDETPTEEYAPLVLRAGKANSTGWQALGNTESALQLYNYTTLLWMVYGNGETSFSSLQNTPVGSTTASTGKFTTLQTNGANTFTKVNAAGGSADVLTLSGTLGIMNGSDTFRGVFLDYTNADHTGSSNTIIGIHVDSITADAEADEIGIRVGSGWDYGLYIESPSAFLGDGSTTKGNVKLYDLDNSTYVGITPADETTSWTMTLPAAAPASVSQVPIFSTAGVGSWLTLDASQFIVTNASNIPETITASEAYAMLQPLIFDADADGDQDTMTDEHLVCVNVAGAVYGLKDCGAKVTDGSTASHWMYKNAASAIENAVISTGLTDTAGTLTVTGVKSGATTGQISITGPGAGQNRVKTVRDANDTIVEAGGDNTFTGANTIGDGGDDQRIVSRINATNERWSGHTIYFAQCAASLAFGTPAYIQSTGKPGAADADAAATMPAIGLIVVASTDADTPCTILTHGTITDTDWNFTTVGATIYTSETVGSVELDVANISDTNDVVQVLGIALHADTLFVSPSLTTIVLE